MPLLLATLVPLAASPENPLIPDTWFQETTATDGSTQQCIIFTTVPGVEYTFYHSDALEAWTEIGKTYGLGQQFAASMRETAPAPPPPDPENPPAPGPELSNASITIQASSAVEGGTVVSWPSLDHGNAIQYLITGNLATDWDTVPMYAEGFGTHQFFISHPSVTTAPPVTNPVLETKDTAMIADLEAAWTTFNASVANSATIARNTPPPPPPAVDAKGFWRIKADWSLDSDNDGSLDHAEFALAAEGPDGNGLVGNPFNGDTDGNGVPDGEELDFDKDGVPDALDIAAQSKLVAFQKVALPRFAVFETGGYGYQINDRGTVLFLNGTWKGGVMTSLVNSGNGLSSGFAVSLNNNDEILGLASRSVPLGNGNNWGWYTASYWATPSAAPVPVQAGANYADGIWINGEEGFRQPAPIFTDAREFFAKSFTIDGGHAVSDSENKLWTIGAGGASASVADLAAGEQGMSNISSSSLYWGNEPDSGNPVKGRVFAPDALPVLPVVPLNVIPHIIPKDGSTAYIATFDGLYGERKTLIYHSAGPWLVSDTYGHAVDISADGTAIGRSHGDFKSPILLNGQWTDITRAAPGLPEGWEDQYRLIDTAPRGWILAEDATNDKTAALLPLRFNGSYEVTSGVFVEEAVGVDDFSIGSFDPDLHPENLEPVRDRIWIMAPKGIDKTVTLKSPLSTGSEVKLSATGVRFNGQSHVTCNSPTTTFTIRAENEFLDGETDMFIDISNGTFDTPALNTPVGIKRMKARTVNVTVYKVGDLLSPGGTVISADRVPDQAVLQAYLNRVYKPQVNVDIVVTIMPLQTETSVDSDSNGYFDWDDDAHTDDQSSIATAAVTQSGVALNTPNITVYLLGTNKKIGSKGSKGGTTPPMRTSWVKCKGNQSHREEEETADVIRTIAMRSAT